MTKKIIALSLSAAALLIGLVGCTKSPTKDNVPTPVQQTTTTETGGSKVVEQTPGETSKVVFQTKPYDIVTTNTEQEVSNLKEFSRAIVTELNKMYYKVGYKYGELTKEQLDKFTTNTAAASRYMDFVESYFPSDSIKLKDISLNTNSEIIAKDRNYYYYQVTAEATLNNDDYLVQSDVTYYLKVSVDGGGNFLVEDIRANLGHLLDGSSETLTQLGEINMVKNKMRNIVSHSIFHEGTTTEAENHLLGAFRDLDSTRVYLLKHPVQQNSVKSIKQIIFNDKDIKFAYAPKADETKMVYKASGTFGVIYKENGITKYQAFKFDGLMSSLNPDGDEYTYVFDSINLNQTQVFDWVQYEKDFIDIE